MKRSIHEKGLTRNGSAQPHPDKPGKYRLLDGVNRWSAFKAMGVAEIDAIIIEDLEGTDSLLYAAQKAIDPKQLTEDEARDTALRAYTKNTSLRSADIGKAIAKKGNYSLET
ncbi:MAG TPA: ParB N-terminal domain-containing protein [Deltaproteobacteria bacterium]|nr:ParB N-terminal domain-containing protein [Deltaproteobacteria bacterium]HIJ42183.1 ParB N-terminal domain-containing protein [Deltaproteobacteria bacterium]